MSQFFDDPDGDALSYTAETSDVTVATTSVAGSVLTLAGLAKGSSIVTVTATDPSGLTASQSFEVTVPNQPPVSIDSIPRLNLESGDSVTVDVTDLFEDPDGDSLGFSAETSDARVATVLPQDSLVTIRGLGEGTATVSVVATDTEGESVTLEGIVTVTNLPPVLVRPIPPQRVRELQSVTVGLMEYFQDPEGGALTFSATVSDTSLATALVSESSMLITGVTAGAATITVTATDLGGLSAQHVVGLAVEPFSEQAALEAIYHAMDGPNWRVKYGWLTNAPLRDWYGVRVEDGRVRKLVLPGNDLAGALPPEIGYLTATEFINLNRNSITAIPPELGRLVNLSGLWLNNNQLAVIPPEIGELSSLRLLWVGENHLTGLPPEIGNLTNLQELYLWRNHISGPLPSEMSRLTNLEWLSLGYNDIAGPIPTSFGSLTNLKRLSMFSSNLQGPIPPELGNLANLTELSLGQNRLTGPIPPELGNLTTLKALSLSYNNLNGSIPSELGNLVNLQRLTLLSNRLTGSIPPELGQLSNLKWLNLAWNRLLGPIPPEFGNLASVQELILSYSVGGGNQLSGAIPSELGRLTTLVALHAFGGTLTGPIPGELGELSNLKYLDLHSNQISGRIPPELGNLSSLQSLDLSNNRLSDSLVDALGALANLRDLDLSENRLSGPIPPEFGGLAVLQGLDLAGNSDMSGILPRSLTELGYLQELRATGTELCAPRDAEFQRWLSNILEQRVATCTESGVSMAYITQAVQSFQFPVPLVAGEEALLRVFVIGDDAGGEHIPAVRATFYHDGAEVGVFDIPQGSDTIPGRVVEGDLSASANAAIPAELFQPGLEMVIEIDPEGTLDPSLNVTRRIPDVGRVEIDVRSVPELQLVVVPFLWAEAPDSAILEQTDDMAAYPQSHELLWATRRLLPVSDVHVNRHELVLTSSNSGPTLAREVAAIQAMDGSSDFYLGMMSGPVEGGVLGSATFRAAGFSVPLPSSIAHAVGHFVGLGHAPCGIAGRYAADPDFPQPNGVIGAWGYDARNGGSLIPPTQPALMSGCRERWISEYYYSYATRHRLTNESSTEASRGPSVTSLLVWGGMDVEGKPYLEPAFVVHAPPTLPQSGGEYELTGQTPTGDTVFSFSFAMGLGDHLDHGAGFAFLLPVDHTWSHALSAITFSTPNGHYTLDGDTRQPMVILRNPRTGAVRGILRDRLQSPGTQAGHPDVTTPYPGLQVLYSHGIPDSTAWRR